MFETHRSFFHRNLALEEKILTNNALPVRVINALREGAAGNKAKAHLLKKWIDDAALRAAILEKFKKAIRQKDTLNNVENPGQCLTDTPELLELWPNCLPEEQLADYRLALVDYLVKELACRDSSISLGIAYRAQGLGEIDLASALLKANCAPVRELPERIKKKLKEIAERS